MPIASIYTICFVFSSNPTFCQATSLLQILDYGQVQSELNQGLLLSCACSLPVRQAADNQPCPSRLIADTNNSGVH